METFDLYQPQMPDDRSHPTTPNSASGFASPADDFLEKPLDLNDYLIHNPAATFFMRVTGGVMQKSGIFDGDILVVDRSREAKNGDVVIVVLNGAIMARRLQRWQNCWRLLSGDGRSFIELLPDDPLHIWGVAVHVIHSF